MKFNKATTIFLILAVIFLMFIVSPLAKMIFSCKLASLYDTICDKEVIHAVWLSLSSAFIATFIVLVFGVPLAYLLARYNFKGKQIIEAVIDLPVVIPHSAAGIALLMIFGQRFFLGKLFGKIGLETVGTQFGVVLGMTFVSSPFLINAAKEAFRLVDPRIENAARTLGATHWQAFRKVTLPASLSAIFSGMIMMWARGISEFGAIVILAYHPMVASVLIFERFEAFGLAYAKPVAVLLVLISLFIFGLLRFYAEHRKYK